MNDKSIHIIEFIVEIKNFMLFYRIYFQLYTEPMSIKYEENWIITVSREVISSANFQWILSAPLISLMLIEKN